MQFSPANTSDQFTTYNDNGLYFRTAPPDLLQASPLADLITEDGNTAVGILALNDAYGTGLAQDDAEQPGERRSVRGRHPSGSPTTPTHRTSRLEVQEMVDFEPDAIVVIGFDESARSSRG